MNTSALFGWGIAGLGAYVLLKTKHNIIGYLLIAAGGFRIYVEAHPELVSGGSVMT